MAEATAAPSAPASSGSRVESGDRRAWRGLWIQLVVIIAAAIAYAVWLLTADLTQQEAQTLNPGALVKAVGEHLLLTLVATVLVLVIAIPLGVLLTRGRLRRAAGPVLAVANFGQAAPAVGLLVLVYALLPDGFWAAIVGLVLYAALPVLRNTMIGIQGVDARLVEAGRGMGMSATSVLFRVELALAVPVMLSGVRTALVLLVGTASLGGFINAGGLGVLITTGINLYLFSVLISGALLIALLALLIDWAGRVVEQVARPKGL